MSKCILVFLFAFVFGSFLIVSLSAVFAGDKRQDDVPAYSSPEALYEAARVAHARKEWRTLYACQSPRARQVLLFEVTFACWMEADRPQVQSFLTKYGADEQTLQAEIIKRYIKKTGISATKITEDLFIREEELIRQVVSDLIRDKVSFIDTAARFVSLDSYFRFGKLTDVKINGNLAVARVETIVSHIEQTPTGEEREVRETVVKAIQFRNCQGSWLFDGAP